MNEQDAYSHLIDIIRSPTSPQLGCYGCDFYLPNLAADFVRKYNPDLGTITPEHPRVKESLPNFQDAAWALCRMGVLRPGPATDQQTSVVGLGYSLTNQGRKWSQQQDSFIYQSPSHFSEILAKYDEIFGDGFRQRSQ
jgi:hypothetical protein